MTTADDDARHTQNLATLAAAKAQEKEARHLRSAASAEASAAYDCARDLYVDSGLAFHGLGESELADSVRRSIERCGKIASNIRHPKAQRQSAVTARPDCLSCGKPLRRYKQDGRTFSDGTPREWGDYGDNRFCGLRCGWSWACGSAPMAAAAETVRLAKTGSK